MSICKFIVALVVVVVFATAVVSAHLGKEERPRPAWLADSSSFFKECDYDCTSDGGPPPGSITHVKHLRPCDVRVVGSLGDSITAAFAARGELWEERGLSYFIGMSTNDTSVTSSKLLRHLNKGALIGGSTQGHIPEIHGGPHDPLQDVLNVAQSEAVIQDLLPGGKGFQLQALLDEIHSLESFGLMKMSDWKLINIWIGANNLCGACRDFHNSSSNSPKHYGKHLNQTLAWIQERIPNTLVSLVGFFNLSQVTKIDAPVAACDLVHDLFIECSCMFKPPASNQQMMDEWGAGYNAEMKSLAAEWSAKNLPGFNVVLQTGLIGFQIPDISFLSTLDCFHPSSEAHEALGIGLFNNMLQPVGGKTSPVTLPVTPTCPGPNARIYS